YLTVLNISSEMIVIYLAMPAACEAMFIVPLAYWADRIGRKRVGIIGGILQAIGFGLMAFAPSLPEAAMRSAIFVGVFIACLGMATFASSWFAILIPIVPDTIRGRFFGRLRTSWQLVAISLAILLAFYLSDDASPKVFQ